MIKHKSYMAKWGRNQYLGYHWDERVGSYRESPSMTYWVARIAVGTANCPHAEDGKCQQASHQHLARRNEAQPGAKLAREEGGEDDN